MLWILSSAAVDQVGGDAFFDKPSLIGGVAGPALSEMP